MLVYLELAAILLVGPTGIYLATSNYSRLIRRQSHGLRRRLIGLIYVLPLVAFATVIYFVNYR